MLCRELEACPDRIDPFAKIIFARFDRRAAEQEDPKKTIKKWHPIPQQPCEGADSEETQSSGTDGTRAPAGADRGEGAAPPDDSLPGLPGVGPQQEYFVPWHLPFHRRAARPSAAALCAHFRNCA